MKKYFAVLLLVSVMGCSKDDNSNMSLTELGLEFTTDYKVQQQIIPSNSPADWVFQDMPDTVVVRFLGNNEATEKHGTSAPVSRGFVLHTRAVRFKEFGLDFYESQTPCTAKTCPKVIAAAGGCTLLVTSTGVILQKPSSTNFLDGYRFIKK